MFQFCQPREVLCAASQLKPVAACSLGHPETGEMFVISNRGAGDVWILTLSLFSARLLGSAVCHLFVYVVQKATKTEQVKRS